MTQAVSQPALLCLATGPSRFCSWAPSSLQSASSLACSVLQDPHILPKKPCYGSRWWFLLHAAKALELRQMCVCVCVCVCVWWGRFGEGHSERVGRAQWGLPGRPGPLRPLHHTRYFVTTPGWVGDLLGFPIVVTT